jgi:hypothetical protein
MALLYRHIRLDKNVPFYIGISDNDKRPYDRNSRSIIWHRIAARTVFEVEIVIDCAKKLGLTVTRISRYLNGKETGGTKGYTFIREHIQKETFPEKLNRLTNGMLPEEKITYLKNTRKSFRGKKLAMIYGEINKLTLTL